MPEAYAIHPGAPFPPKTRAFCAPRSDPVCDLTETANLWCREERQLSSARAKALHLDAALGTSGAHYAQLQSDLHEITVTLLVDPPFSIYYNFISASLTAM